MFRVYEAVHAYKFAEIETVSFLLSVVSTGILMASNRMAAWTLRKCQPEDDQHAVQVADCGNHLSRISA